jgi:phenylalanyl-tRNA synthetase alpha chain
MLSIMPQRSMQIEINSPEETEIKKQLEVKDDPESKRLIRFLNMPDLTRDKESPIYELVQRILRIKQFSDFDDIKVPEIVPTEISFDLFDFPDDHPVRSKSHTYYVNEKNILRTHTTVMWYYWLNQQAIKEKIKNKESIGLFCYGKVYRKDEIDRNHMPVFHQVDGWYLTPKDKKIITTQDLDNVLAAIAKAIFGPEIKYRFNEDKFPYTDPSLEMEVDKEGNWLEVVGAGVVKGSVLDKLGVDSSKYNGWAFGFGLERLAIISMDLPDIRLLWSEDKRVKKQLKLGQKFVPVSKYPAITRDISFVVGKDFIPNNYFDLIRDLGGNLVEEVQLIDKYEDATKFGQDRISYTYRIIYRSNERTLVSSEVDAIQDKIYQETAKQFKADLR